jgi:hypothetical protein
MDYNGVEEAFRAFAVDAHFDFVLVCMNLDRDVVLREAGSI